MKKILFTFLMLTYVSFVSSQTGLKDITSYIPANERNEAKAKAVQIFNGKSVTNQEKFQAALQFVQSNDAYAQKVGLCILDNLQIEKYAEADFLIGELFLNGHIVESNITQCIAWTEKAANEGSSFAWSRLGYFYNNGLGVNKDIPKAINYFKKGAEMGDGEAMYNLGSYYYGGGQINEAIEYFEQCISSGNYNPVSSMYNLGVIYYEKEEYNKSYDLFNKLVRIADISPNLFSVKSVGADGVLSKVYNYYATFYDKGIPPVNPDLQIAKEYYRKAADNGHTRAAIRLEELR